MHPQSELSTRVVPDKAAPARINWNEVPIAYGGIIYPPGQSELHRGHRKEMMSKFYPQLSTEGRLSGGENPHNVFPVLADIFAIQDNQLNSMEQIAPFAITQELTAIDEHGARSRITELQGHMTPDGRIMMGDMNIGELAAKSLAQNPTDKRLLAEKESIDNLIQSIQANPSGTHLVFSPAKLNFGDKTSYGLAFLFELGGVDGHGNRHITQKIISYAEMYGLNDASKEYLKKIISSHGGTGIDIRHIDALTTEDLMKNIIHVKAEKKDEDWSKLFQISPAEQTLSKQFKDELYKRKRIDLNRYAELLYEYRDITPDTERSRVDAFLSEANMLKDKLFGYGVQLAKAMRSGDLSALDAYDQSESAFLQSQSTDLSASMTHAQLSALAYYHQIGQFGQAFVESTQCPSSYLQNAATQAGGSVYGAFGVLAREGFVGIRPESNKKTSIWVKQLNKYITVDYAFDHRNECRICKRSTSVGPCNICLNCTADIIAKEHQGKAQ